MIPFLDLRREYAGHKQAYDEALLRSASGGSYVLGREVEAFEREFAAYCGAREAVGVGSGTDALALALRAHGIQPGDEVILPASIPFAPVLAVLMAGGKPVPADIHPFTYTLDPVAIEEVLSARSRFIMPVHLYGLPAHMDEIRAMAARNNLTVIEDGAQAHGAEYHGKKIGGGGFTTCFSFYPTKNLAAMGDGGIVVTDDRTVADRVRSLRFYGEESRHKHRAAGVNSRLDELHAAVLSVKLKSLDSWNERRREIARRYTEEIKNPDVIVQHVPNTMTHAFHLFVVRTPFRDELMNHLAADGIGTCVHYPIPVHLQPVWRETQKTQRSFPVAERHAQEVLSLPCYPALTGAEVTDIIASINRFKGRR